MHLLSSVQDFIFNNKTNIIKHNVESAENLA